MSFKGKMPSHATVVAYLALFIALATGVSYAATKITSSKQLAKNVVKGKQVKNNALGGKDIRDGSIAAADLLDGSVGAGEIADGSVGAADIADGVVGTAEVANGSLTGQDLDLAELGLGQTFSAKIGNEIAVDNGDGFTEARIPEGTVARLDVPAGKYLIAARTLIRSNGNEGGALCDVFADGDEVASAAGATDEGDFGLSPATYESVAVTFVADFDAPTTLDYACSDGNSGDVRASARAIDAVRLPG